MDQRYRFALVGVLLILVGTVAVGAAGQVTATTEDDEEWLEMKTDTFVIEYQDGYEDEAAYIGDVSENAYVELEEAFPEDVSEPTFEEEIHIRVYPGDMWEEPDYVLYWKDGGPIRIHVQAASDSVKGDDWYEHGLAHEIGNMFLWDEAGQYDNYNYYQRNPSWFHQGLTEYYVYNTPTVEEQFPPWAIEDWNETITAGNGEFRSLADDVYHGGHLLSMYLVDEYGEDAVWDLIRNDAANWGEAVTAELDVTPTELETNWYRWAEENIGGDYSDRTDSPDEPEEALEGAEAEVDELEGELETKQTEIEQLKSERDELEGELEEKQTEIDQLESELDELKEEIEEVDQEADNPEDEDGAGFGVGVAFVSIFAALYLMTRRFGDEGGIH